MSLTYIYGIYFQRNEICRRAQIDPMLSRDLSESNIAAIPGIAGAVEGDLRRQVAQNIRRLIAIALQRLRHRRNLPARGQRTKTSPHTQGRQEDHRAIRDNRHASTGNSRHRSAPPHPGNIHQQQGIWSIEMAEEKLMSLSNSQRSASPAVEPRRRVRGRQVSSGVVHIDSPQQYSSEITDQQGTYRLSTGGNRSKARAKVQPTHR